MPYQAKQDDRCPAGKPWGVTKSTDGELMGCHASEEDAMDQVAALYANEPRDDEPRGIELRMLDTELEFRDAEEGIGFSGYAAMFNSPSRPMPFVETVLPGAFARSLRQDRDIKLLVDHNPEKMLASKEAGTLRLSEDERGLRVDADMAPTSYANDLRILAKRREVRSMSFAFKPTKTGEAWSLDGKQRSLSEVRLFEVSILTGHAPAYEHTSAFIRALAHELEAQEDSLAEAIWALADGRLLSADEARLLNATVARLSPAAVPFPIHQRRSSLMAKLD